MARSQGDCCTSIKEFDETKIFQFRGQIVNGKPVFADSCGENGYWYSTDINRWIFDLLNQIDLDPPLLYGLGCPNKSFIFNENDILDQNFDF